PVHGDLDAAGLGEAGIAPSDDHLAAQLDAVDTRGVVRLVADVRVRLPPRLDVGADPAVEQEIDRRAQDRADHLYRSERGCSGVEAELLARLGRHRNRLDGTRVDAPAG